MTKTHPFVHALGVTALLVFVGLVVYLSPLEPSLVQLQLTFSGPAFAAVYGGWTELAQARFRSHFVADYVFIALYMLWGYWYAGQSPAVARLQPSQRRVAMVLLPLAGVADVVEGILHTSFVAQGLSTVAPWLYALAGSAATLKWLCIVGFAVLVALAHWRRRLA